MSSVCNDRLCEAIRARRLWKKDYTPAFRPQHNAIDLRCKEFDELVVTEWLQDDDDFERQLAAALIEEAF